MLDLFEGLNKTIEEFHYIVFFSGEINAYSGKHDSPHKNFSSPLSEQGGGQNFGGNSKHSTALSGGPGGPGRKIPQ